MVATCAKALGPKRPAALNTYGNTSANPAPANPDPPTASAAFPASVDKRRPAAERRAPATIKRRAPNGFLKLSPHKRMQSIISEKAVNAIGAAPSAAPK